MSRREGTGARARQSLWHSRCPSSVILKASGAPFAPGPSGMDDACVQSFRLGHT